MLSDITIGQYFPGKSIVHRLDPRMKLVLIIAFIVVLFVVSSALSFLVLDVFLIITILLSKIPIKAIWKGIKPILPLVLFTAVLNLFFVDGTPLVTFWVFRITVEGLQMAGLMAVRIVTLIVVSSLLTYTTSPIALTDALERLLGPLRFIRFPVHEMAMMMTIALRFIPTLLEETDKIMSAQKARGADLETGGIMKRAKALIPILIPLFVSAFRRAEELALAMECRCYRGGDGRTRMKQLKLKGMDFSILAIVVGVFAGAIVLNIFVPFLF